MIAESIACRTSVLVYLAMCQADAAADLSAWSLSPRFRQACLVLNVYSRSITSLGRIRRMNGRRHGGREDAGFVQGTVSRRA